MPPKHTRSSQYTEEELLSMDREEIIVGLKDREL